MMFMWGMYLIVMIGNGFKFFIIYFWGFFGVMNGVVFKICKVVFGWIVSEVVYGIFCCVGVFIIVN